MALVERNLSASAGNMRHGFDPWLGRSPGDGNGNSLQNSCLEDPMDRRARWAPVRGIETVECN